MQVVSRPRLLFFITERDREIVEMDGETKQKVERHNQTKETRLAEEVMDRSIALHSRRDKYSVWNNIFIESWDSC